MPQIKKPKRKPRAVNEKKPKRKPGRKPRAVNEKTQNHYISDEDRAYLRCPRGERKDRYGPSSISRYEQKIRLWVHRAMEDMVLIANNYPENRVNTVFKVEDVYRLLYAVNSKIGPDFENDYGVYYQVLIKGIESAMNSSADNRLKTKTHVTCQIIEQPMMQPNPPKI
jgi:hypothetical protein